MTEAKERHRVQAGRELVVEQAKLPESPSSPRSILQTIAEAAANPYCDAEKMRALHQLLKDIEEHEGKKAFTRAFNALQAELPAITRDGKIDHSSDGGDRTRSGKKALKTAYATYPNIMRVVNPLLKKHGFTLSNVVEPTLDGARINVVGYLEHIDGHSRISRFPMSIDVTGGKNNQQGWGSSQQYAMRYNAIALLNIVSEAAQDQDNDGYSKGPISKQDIRDHVEGSFPGDRISDDQFMKLKEAIEGCGVPEAKVLEKYNIEKLRDLPVAKFTDAMTACRHYAEQARG